MASTSGSTDLAAKKTPIPSVNVPISTSNPFNNKSELGELFKTHNKMIEMQNYLLSPKGSPSAILNDDNDEIMVQTHPEVFL